MSFYTFSQNNSGGRFFFTKDPALTHFVIIEADDAQDACTRAIEIGIYFDGVSRGEDCGCCGDRWHRPWNDGTEHPEIYQEAIKFDAAGAPLPLKTPYPIWLDPERGHTAPEEIVIHYKDGRIVWVPYESKTPRRKR